MATELVAPRVIWIVEYCWGGHKEINFILKLSLYCVEWEILYLTYCLSICLSWSFILMQRCVLSHVTKILMQAILNVHAACIWFSLFVVTRHEVHSTSTHTLHNVGR